jgi:hypothetical protein
MKKKSYSTNHHTIKDVPLLSNTSPLIINEQLSHLHTTVAEYHQQQVIFLYVLIFSFMTSRYIPFQSEY